MPLRSASCGSPAGRVAAMATRLASVAVVSSVSIRAMRPGCSFWAVWISAQAGGVRQIGSTVIGAGADGVAGHDHQVGAGGVGAGQPVLQLGKRVAGQGMQPAKRMPAGSDGSGQITRSGAGVKVARSVWIAPLCRLAGR